VLSARRSSFDLVTRRSWVLFSAMCVIWGIPYLLIRVAVRDLNPETVVFARTAIGAVLLLPVAVWRGVFPALRGQVGWLLAFTAVELAIPWLLLTRAEEHLTSSLAGLLVAAVPLVGIGISRLLGFTEHMTARRWAGLVIGVAGVACLVGLQVGHIDLAAVGEVFLVAVGYAIGPLIQTHRLSSAPSLAVVTASLAITAVVYAPFALTSHPHDVGAKVIWSVIGLAVICTALAFLVFFALIGAIGPTRATVITYVNPAVAVLLGVAVLGEHLTTGMIVGFPLVLLGSVLATAQPRKPSGQPEPVLLPEEPAVTPG
jgi:drug/metabolite transporter (DMT)-like permease